MTDLERELRATMIEAGERAPVVEDLVSRAATPVRRRRTWLASGVAAVTMAAVGVAIAVTAPSGNETAGVSTPSTSASTQTGALIGNWRPVDIVGFDNSALPPPGLPAGRAPNITFTSDGRWRGSDGCNAIGGTYSASDDGSISTANSAQTLIGCPDVITVPNSEVLERAARFAIDGRSLTFYAAGGQRLGTYERV
jgi:heat shock protein HslJ